MDCQGAHWNEHLAPEDKEAIGSSEAKSIDSPSIPPSPQDLPGSSRGYSDEIPQYPAKIVKRSAAICSRIPTDEIAPAGMECSQSGPACYMPERKEVSGYRQEVARSILEPEGAMRLPPSSKEGSSFDSSFWASFGSIDISKSHDGESQQDSGDKLHVQVLSAFFHLGCTNVVAKSTVGVLSLRVLQDALVKTLEEINVDIVEFVACHFSYECSFAQGNQFMSFLVRVFKPPTKSSGQLLDADVIVAEKIEGGFLVELQLQQGDRLQFSSLFRDLLLNFTKSQDEISLTGTLRYKPRPFPEKGEGLVLEKNTNLEKPSRLGTRQPEKCVGEMSVSIPREPMDEDMMDDVLKLAEALDAGFLDVQADAATAIAGLTSDVELRNQLCDPRAKKAADALCRASARLLVETEHRPARRQAAVTVANLASTPALCRSLLESDPPLTSTKRGIVDSLVALAMLRSKEEKEEEIGTRRECIRALIGLAGSRSTRNMPAMRSLLSTTPSGRGSKCKRFMERLKICKDVLTRPATFV
ncbi:unnamed protein product [Ascophyllum nodosum]